LVVCRAANDLRNVAYFLHLLGSVALQQGDYDRATVLHEESLKIYFAQDDEKGMATARLYLGHLARYNDVIGTAIEFYRRSLAAQRRLDDKFGITTCL